MAIQNAPKNKMMDAGRVRLKFVKPWGTFKTGDFKDTDSPTTTHYLTKVYGVAVIDEGKPKPYFDYRVADIPSVAGAGAGADTGARATPKKRRVRKGA